MAYIKKADRVSLEKNNHELVKKAKKVKAAGPVDFVDDDFTVDLINQLNKESGDKIAFNLGTDDAPTNIKRWISTGSKQLDFIISNQLNGGLPEGRIIEIQGPPSCGKSHIAFEVAKSTQKMGGIVVYIDTENATSLQNLKQLGIDVSKGFVFVQTGCTEEVFKTAESTILKARAMKKDVPVTIIWDSVAATSPKAELEGNYDKDTIGLQARVLGKGMRKIANIIGNQNVLFLLLNQQRQKIGVMFGDPTTTPGGMSIPYTSSVRIKISSTGQSLIMRGDMAVGVKVKAKTIKNKVARPFRECEFQIHFGIGVREEEEVFDLFRAHCETLGKDSLGVKVENHHVMIAGTGAWKTFTITDGKTGEVIVEKKFYKADFKDIVNNPEYKDYIDALFESSLTMNAEATDHPTFAGLNSGSIEEVNAVKEQEER